MSVVEQYLSAQSITSYNVSSRLSVTRLLEAGTLSIIMPNNAYLNPDAVAMRLKCLHVSISPRPTPSSLLLLLLHHL